MGAALAALLVLAVWQLKLVGDFRVEYRLVRSAASGADRQTKLVALRMIPDM